MQYRTLGRSGLRLSTLTLGTMTFGGGGKFAQLGDGDVTLAKRMLDICRDAGVNSIDTANMYSYGKSEEIIGEALRGRREDFVLASKVRMPMGDGPNDGGASRKQIVAQCEASLRRLGCDYLDLYYLHQWDGITPLDESLEALDTLIERGHIRYAGVSNYSAWQLMKALGVAERRGFEAPVAHQIYYSLESRDAEFELIPAALDQGVGLTIWSPLAGGLLSGKYTRDGNAADGRRLAGWTEPPITNEDRLFDTVDVLKRIAQARNAQPSQIALAWTLAQPGVTSLVIGARKEEQLRANLMAAELSLSRAELDELTAVSRPRLPYPLWHRQQTALDRPDPAEAPLFERYPAAE